MGSGGMVGGMLYKRSFSCQVLVLEEFSHLKMDYGIS